MILIVFENDPPSIVLPVFPVEATGGRVPCCERPCLFSSSNCLTSVTFSGVGLVTPLPIRLRILLLDEPVSLRTEFLGKEEKSYLKIFVLDFCLVFLKAT